MQRAQLLTPIAAAAGLAALVASAPSSASHVRAADASQLVVSPLNGTPDASPSTQISFLGAPPSELSGITVNGSKSGAHAGTLEPYSSEPGASFVLAKHFKPGERVTVGYALTVGNTTTRNQLKFTVATPAATPRTGSPLATSTQATQAFVTRHDLRPPRLRISVNSPAAASGDIFIAPLVAPAQLDVKTGKPVIEKNARLFGQYAPTILDGNGRLVWTQPVPRGLEAFDFRPQFYRGAPALTWWQGRLTATGVGFGDDVIIDSSYRPVATVHGGNGYRADLHEFLLAPDGSAYVTEYAPVIANLGSRRHPKRGILLDSVVQRVDVQTGLVMFEWHFDGHVPAGDSMTKPVPGQPWDAWHLNSIDFDGSGNLLLSARQTWAVYNVAPTGAISWQLGGRHSNFKLARGVRFAWQHDARFQLGGAISVFDDEAAPEVGHQSRGELISLDTVHHVASLVHAYGRPSPLIAGSQGNAEVLPGGHVFVGWGSLPFMSEFDAAGHLVFDAHFHGHDETYRAFRFPWTGIPTGAPAMAIHKAPGGQGDLVYASWNGATEIASWRVVGPDGSVLATSGRAGFETAIPVNTSAPSIAVQALTAAGQVLGTSSAQKP